MSEFYKIKADFLLYGFANNNETDFSRLIIINLTKLQYINIIPQEDIGYHAYIDNDSAIIAPILGNKNGDSEFIAIGIDLLFDCCPHLIANWV